VTASADPGGPSISDSPALTRRLERLAGGTVREARLLGAQHRWRHYRVTLTDGRVVFAKAAVDDVAGIFEAEARGLRWLADAGAVAVPQVLGWDRTTLVLAWVAQQAPDRLAAEQFGRDLAVLHAAGAERFGSPWPGFIASLPLGDRTGDTGAGGPYGAGGICGAGAASSAWADWYASKRLLPYLRLAADTGVLTAGDAGLVEAVIGRLGDLAGPAEPPSRIHGDCWSGNVLWSGGQAWLIDPAAHGGHREADLAMLALFGAPHLDRIVACYQEVAPLADGWQARVPLHQLHPLLVHVCLFGTGYRSALLDTARAALAGRPGQRGAC
jgi:fructosamine-3-kinase